MTTFPVLPVPNIMPVHAPSKKIEFDWLVINTLGEVDSGESTHISFGKPDCYQKYTWARGG